MFIKNKEWYKSKTVIVSFAALIVAISSAAYGESSPYVAALVAVLSSLGIYGRFDANTQLKY